MIRYTLAIILAHLFLIGTVYSHDTLAIKDGEQTHTAPGWRNDVVGDDTGYDPDNFHYHYFKPDGRSSWDIRALEGWVEDENDTEDGGDYAEQPTPDIVLPDGTQVELDPSPLNPDGTINTNPFFHPAEHHVVYPQKPDVVVDPIKPDVPTPEPTPEPVPSVVRPPVSTGTTPKATTPVVHSGFIPEPHAPRIIPPSVKVTEIMFRDWSRSGGAGRPQWIELYNSGGDTNLEGYSIVFHEQVHHRTREPIDDLVVTFGAFPFPSNHVLIVSKQHYTQPWHVLGVDPDQLYVNTAITNLKHKWTLYDRDYNVVYSRNQTWNTGIGGHNADRGRVSVEILPTEPPAEGVEHHYGGRIDTSTPGHHVPIVPAAPSLQNPKLVTMWATLKRR